MAAQPLPHDLDAEDAVIGAMLSVPVTQVPEAVNRLTPADFYNPVNGLAFDVMARLWRSGREIDPTAVRSEMREAGNDPGWEWLVDRLKVAATVATNAETVIRMRARRQIVAAVTEAADAARTPGVDPFALIDRLRAHLVTIDAPSGRPSEDLYQLDDFLDAPESDEAEWVVPGLFRRDWRVIVVAGEGSGKSLLARQMTVASAQGMHPLTFDEMPPIRTLLVDLENPRGALAGSCRKMRGFVAEGKYRRGEAWVWHRPGGFDLRSRALKAEFEANVALAKPDLVCVGPLYKAYAKDNRETDEQAVVEVQAALDDLRTRHGFALFMEHHAPQADSGGHRQMRPYGSSFWLRWPEIGIGMVKADPDNEADRTMDLARWRGDRMVNGWPKRLLQGTTWPWVAG